MEHFQGPMGEKTKYNHFIFVLKPDFNHKLSKLRLMKVLLTESSVSTSTHMASGGEQVRRKAVGSEVILISAPVF